VTALNIQVKIDWSCTSMFPYAIVGCMQTPFTLFLGTLPQLGSSQRVSQFEGGTHS